VPISRSRPTITKTPLREATGAGAVFAVQMFSMQIRPDSQSVVSSQGPPSITGVFVGVPVTVFVGVTEGEPVGVLVGVADGVLDGVLVGVADGVAVGVAVGIGSHWQAGPLICCEGPVCNAKISTHCSPGGHSPSHSGAPAKPHWVGQLNAVQDVLSPM
jgi:hypothetical protein